MAHPVHLLSAGVGCAVIPESHQWLADKMRVRIVFGLTRVRCKSNDLITVQKCAATATASTEPISHQQPGQVHFNPRRSMQRCGTLHELSHHSPSILARVRCRWRHRGWRLCASVVSVSYGTHEVCVCRRISVLGASGTSWSAGGDAGAPCCKRIPSARCVYSAASSPPPRSLITWCLIAATGTPSSPATYSRFAPRVTTAARSCWTIAVIFRMSPRMAGQQTHGTQLTNTRHTTGEM
jgi:hypothetical protein